MNEQSMKNKIAWEHRAYEFWQNQGSPSEKAAYIKKMPRQVCGITKNILSRSTA